MIDKELMTGDYIKYKDGIVRAGNSYGRSDNRQVLICYVGMVHAVGYTEITPIKLTDIWFEANEFMIGKDEYDNSVYYDSYTNCRLIKKDDDGVWYLDGYEDIIEIQYVHELQHLLSVFKNYKREFVLPKYLKRCYKS